MVPEYLIISVGFMSLFLFLDIYYFKFNIIKQRKFWFVTLFTVLVFTVWDFIAISRAHWAFGEKYLIGFYASIIPFE